MQWHILSKHSPSVHKFYQDPQYFKPKHINLSPPTPWGAPFGRKNVRQWLCDTPFEWWTLMGCDDSLWIQVAARNALRVQFGGVKYLLRRYLDPLGLSSNLCLWRFFWASHYIPKDQQRTWKWLFPNGISSSRGPFVMFFSGVLGSKKAKPSSQSLLVVLTPYTLSPILMVENGYVWKGNDPIGDTPILDDYGRKGTSTRLVV